MSYVNEVNYVCSVLFRETLQDPTMLNFLSNSDQIIFWGCNVNSPEGYRVSQILKENAYPFVGVIGLSMNPGECIVLNNMFIKPCEFVKWKKLFIVHAVIADLVRQRIMSITDENLLVCTLVIQLSILLLTDLLLLNDTHLRYQKHNPLP